MKRLILCFLLFSCTVIGTYAQSDTVHSLNVIHILPDSTRISHELYWVSITNSLGRSFLQYQDSSADLFRTKPFIATSADTLGFNRCPGFDDKDYLRPFLVDKDNAEDMIAIQAAANEHYNDREIIPADSSFGTLSSVKFITEVCKTSNNDAVLSLDTVICFRNLNGYLRFQNYPNSINIRKGIPLTGLQNDTSYYVHVKRVDNLPLGSGFIGYVFEIFPHNSGTDLFFVTNHQVYTPPSPKKSSPKSSPDNNLVITSLSPNPTSGKFRLSVRSSQRTEAGVSIIDYLGKNVFTQSVSLNSGMTEVPLDMTSLPSGTYEIVVSVGGSKSNFNFSLIK